MTASTSRPLQELLELADSGTWGDPAEDDGGAPVLRSSNVVDNRLDLTNVAMRAVPARHYATKRLKGGDIIVVTSSGSPAHIGKCCLFREPASNRPFYFSNFTLRLRPDTNQVDPRWIFYWLTSMRGRAVLDGMNATTSGLRNLNKHLYLAQKVPLPPLAEQRRIAAMLDKADAVRRKRREAARLLDEFLRSVFLEMFGDPVRNEKGWEVRKLGDVLEAIDSGWSPTCMSRQAGDDEWGVLKLGAVTSCTYLEGENKALGEGHEPRPELEVRSGDLLMTRKNTRDLVAACAYVGETRDRLMISDLVYRLRLQEDSGVHPLYLWATLTHTGMRRRLQQLARGSAGSMPNISKGRLAGIEVPVPPVRWQERLLEAAATAERLRSTLEEGNRDNDQFFNSLAQRAFRGG